MYVVKRHSIHTGKEVFQVGDPVTGLSDEELESLLKDGVIEEVTPTLVHHSVDLESVSSEPPETAASDPISVSFDPSEVMASGEANFQGPDPAAVAAQPEAEKPTSPAKTKAKAPAKGKRPQKAG